MRCNWLKRMIDIIAAIVGLIVLAPVLIIVAAAVRFSIGAPVLFRQTRPGLGGKPFVMFKFRTMVSATFGDNQDRSDKERLSCLGRFLRATSLDELPELWNVLRGQMSLVGPRPLLEKYLELYTPFQARRHEVKPGITGWAQINGRNAITWEKKFELDVWYVENQSLWLDLKILLSTVIRVFCRKNINAASFATMPEFQANCKFEKHHATECLVKVGRQRVSGDR